MYPFPCDHLEGRDEVFVRLVPQRAVKGRSLKTFPFSWLSQLRLKRILHSFLALLRYLGNERRFQSIWV